MLYSTLAIQPRLLAYARRAYSLSSPTLSLLCIASVLTVDKAATFAAPTVAALLGYEERDCRRYIQILESMGFISRVGGRRYYRAQSWAVSGQGRAVLHSIGHEVERLLSPLQYRS